MKLWLLTLGSTAALVALVWLGAVTRAEVPTFEVEPPPALVDFFAYYRPNAERAFARLARWRDSALGQPTSAWWAVSRDAPNGGPLPPESPPHAPSSSDRVLRR